MGNASIFSFVIGIFIFITLGFNLYVGGFDWVSIIGCPFGAFMVYQHGWIKDNSKWRFKPALILLISIAFTLILFLILFHLKGDNNVSVVNEDGVIRASIDNKHGFELKKPER